MSTTHADIPEPCSPVLRGRVLIALRKAGRPVTLGEMRSLYLTGQARHGAILEVLEGFVADGSVVRGSDWDARHFREFVTYRLAEDDPV